MVWGINRFGRLIGTGRTIYTLVLLEIVSMTSRGANFLERMQTSFISILISGFSTGITDFMIYIFIYAFITLTYVQFNSHPVSIKVRHCS